MSSQKKMCSNLIVLYAFLMILSAVESVKLDVEPLGVTKEEQFECGSEQNRHQGSFSIYDGAVVGAMLIISLGIGAFYGFFEKDQTSSDDFLHGSEMGLLPVSLSLTTSFITAIELLGNPAEVFFYGTQYSLIVISMFLVIPVAIYFFYPIYYKLELTSCYEYLGIRFGNKIRVFGAILYIIQMCFYTAVSVYAPAIALSKATGLNTRLAVFLIYVVCIFYSSQGGMKAVVIADTFQAAVLAFSLFLIVGLGYVYTGGFTDIYGDADIGGRLEIGNFDTSPLTRHTVFSVVVGGFFYWTSLLCTNQASVQKCMSLKSRTKTNLALILSIFGLVLIFVINFYTGLTMFANFKDCDPVKAGYIDGKDELLPFYIMKVFGHLHFVNGFFVAGVFAASLGTVAAALNSLSAVTTQDIIATGLKINVSPDNSVKYAKWMSLGYGILSFMLVFLVEQLGGILQATLTLNGLIGGVTLGLFALGIFFTSANEKGALYGGLISLVAVIYIGVIALLYNEEAETLLTSVDSCDCFTPNQTSINEFETKEESAAIFRISYIWYSFLGTVLTILFGLLISMVSESFARNQEDSMIKKRPTSQSRNPVFTITEKCGKFTQVRKVSNGLDNFAYKTDSKF